MLHVNLWIICLGRVVQRLFGISVDLAGLELEDTDLALDLHHGRER